LARELHGQLRDLQLEVVDQPQADVDVLAPRIRDREAVQQLAAGVAEQIGDRAGVTEGDQRGVDAVSSASCGDRPGAAETARVWSVSMEAVA
jgi:hypothetical protein